MLVDVVQLRRLGERRSREEVHAAVPHRGILSLTPGRPGHHAGQKDAPLLAGLTPVEGCTWLIPPLDHARVSLIRAGRMIIVGVEEEDRGRGNVQRYRQAWWVRPVGGTRPPSTAVRRPSSEAATELETHPAAPAIA